MAVHVIAGVMGSGKSFESVKEKILPALRNGQRVVSNISGLNHSAIAAYISKPVAEVEGLLCVVRDEQVSQPDFYPSDADDVASVVKPGDLLVLDEVWKFYKKGLALSDRCMNFYRMHRHWASEATGLTTEIVLCIQSIRGLHPDIRDVVEVRFQCRKLKILGKPEHYQVWLYEGDERRASHHFDRKYDPEIFPLYKSHAKGGAVEQFDQRQSIYSRPFFRFVLPIALLLIPVGGYGAYWSLSRLTHRGAAPAALASAAPVSTAAPGAAPAASAALGSGAASGWRIVASYRAGDLPVVLLVDDKGRYRTLTPGALSTGAAGELYVPVPRETDVATPWAGSSATYTSKGGQAPPTK